MPLVVELNLGEEWLEFEGVELLVEERNVLNERAESVMGASLPLVVSTGGCCSELVLLDFFSSLLMLEIIDGGADLFIRRDP